MSLLLYVSDVHYDPNNRIPVKYPGLLQKGKQ
jgi:hypothetical protein